MGFLFFLDDGCGQPIAPLQMLTCLECKRVLADRFAFAEDPWPGDADASEPGPPKGFRVGDRPAARRAKGSDTTWKPIVLAEWLDAKLRHVLWKFASDR